MASRFDFVPASSNANALVSTQLIVAVEVGGTVVGREQQIEVAVAIKIGVSQTAPDLGLRETAANFGGRVVKSSLTIVEKQLRWLRVSDSTNVAHGVVNVSVDHGQVECAIEVGVEESATESQFVLRGEPNAALGRDVV